MDDILQPDPLLHSTVLEDQLITGVIDLIDKVPDRFRNRKNPKTAIPTGMMKNSDVDLPEITPCNKMNARKPNQIAGMILL